MFTELQKLVQETKESYGEIKQFFIDLSKAAGGSQYGVCTVQYWKMPAHKRKGYAQIWINYASPRDKQDYVLLAHDGPEDRQGIKIVPDGIYSLSGHPASLECLEDVFTTVIERLTQDLEITRDLLGTVRSFAHGKKGRMGELKQIARQL